ncbi:Kae1-associated serine/threonine protein kinase [archaeon]|nr:Kae1-associated serine/threonine protein kinase [archaeon]
MKIIKQGAEAILYLDKNNLVKERIVKNYRLKEIDDSLRKSRTRREAKLLKKADVINVPKVIEVDDKSMKITMEYIQGDLIKDILDSLKEEERRNVCKQIGEEVANLHNLDIIHGDLTTSNMILKNSKVYFIDFGLGFVDPKVEHKAVDLHLLRQALESKHYKYFEDSFKHVLLGYKKSKEYNEVLKRLKKVEKRGRYKSKND